MKTHKEVKPGQRAALAGNGNAPSSSTEHSNPDMRARDERIALLAYYKAQQRGFDGNGQLDDWLAAEREIDAAEHAAPDSQRWLERGETP